MSVSLFTYKGHAEPIYSSGSISTGSTLFNIYRKLLGWGDVSNKSFYPLKMENASSNAYIQTLFKSSPLYTTGYSATGMSYDGINLKFLSNNDGGVGYRFLETSAEQAISSEKQLVYSQSAGLGNCTLQSVLYGTLRKLSVGTDYNEEIRYKNDTRAAIINPVTNFEDLTLLTGPYNSLHDENPATSYNLTSQNPGDYTYFIHKITFEDIEETAIRGFFRGIMGHLSSYSQGESIHFWNFVSNSWDTLIYQNTGTGGIYANLVKDVSKTSGIYVSNNTMYVCMFGATHSTRISTSYYMDMDLWGGYTNPTDI